MLWSSIEEGLKKQGINQAELARRCGLSRVKITQMKMGITKTIDIHLAFKIADALGIDVNEFRKELDHGASNRV